MVKRLSEKPEGYFNKTYINSMWFELSYQKERYAYIGIEFLKTLANLHMEVTRWSHTTARAFSIDWEEIKHMCKSLGIKELIVSNDDLEDKRWPKFIKMYGFEKPILVSKMEI